MIIRKPTPLELKFLRGIANYQFGRNAGDILVPNEATIAISPSTMRIRHVMLKDKIIITLRPSDAFFSLHIYGGILLHKNYSFPLFRVIVRNDVASFIAEGHDVFAKHVVNVDNVIRAGDEVIVVDENDEILAVGRSKLCPNEMLSLKRGVAVRVRHAIKA